MASVKPITMSAPDVSADDAALVGDVLRSRSLSIGPMIDRFEADWCARFGSAHAVAVSSGTAGLHMALIAAGVTDHDLVLTSSFSFVASANAAMYERAVPVFVDIDPVTFNMDPAALASALADLDRGGTAAARWLPPDLRSEKAGRVKAVVPVHVFGQPADMPSIMASTQRHGVTVVEDACEALGAERDGRTAGRFGAAGVFGFYPNKQMTTGEGGMVVTDDAEWARVLRSLRNQGRDDDSTWLRHVRLGYNYRLDEMSAALGVAQLGRLDTLLDNRARVASAYGERLAGLDGLTLPQIVRETTRASWFVYVVRLSPEVDREKVMAGLAQASVPSKPYFAPIHLQPFYRERFGYRGGELPVTEAIASSTLALPFHGRLDDDQIDYIGTALQQAIDQSRRPLTAARER